MKDDAPRFPFKLVWKETGEEELFEDEKDLVQNLEDYDSSDSDDADAVTVVDAIGRPVHLRVKIWMDMCEYRLADPV